MNTHKLAITIRAIAGLVVIFCIVLIIIFCTNTSPLPHLIQRTDSEPIVAIQEDTCEDDTAYIVDSALSVWCEPEPGFDFDTIYLDYCHEYHTDSVLIIEHKFTDTTFVWGAQ